MNAFLFKIDEQFEKDEAKLRKENAKLAHKLWTLVFDIAKHPFDGLGKPEPLKGDLAGCWSRRIDEKHRLIYSVEKDIIHLLSCYGHYV